MPPILLSRRARVFIGPASGGWAWLGSVYATGKTEKRPVERARRAMFCNASLAVLGQVEVFPQLRSRLFASLLEHVGTSHSLDGLESAFLTLLNAALIERQNDLF